MVPSLPPHAVRVRLDIAYDGTRFVGWAAQPGLRAVETVLSEALATILRTSPPRLTVGGRTDAGVHARGSVCHVDVDEQVWRALPGRASRTPEQSVVRRLNGVLPSDVVVLAATVMPDSFDARFSAQWRRYSYRISDSVATIDPLRRQDTVHRQTALDVAAMDEASHALLGLRDFAAFCRRRVGASTVRTLLDYSWARDDRGVIVGTVRADAFCHSMVRALVGSVVAVGEGRRPVSWPREVLDAAVRHPAVTVMAAHGLCLEEIRYPPVEDVGAQAQRNRVFRELPADEGRA